MIAVALADLPLPAVHCSHRGKVLSTTPMAAALFQSAPELVAKIVSLVVQNGGRSGTVDVVTKLGGQGRYRLVLVPERSAPEPGACVVFVLRDAEHPDTMTDRLAGLTAREREVATHAAAGRRNWEIAAELGCRERTIRAHLQATYLKLGIKRRVELATIVAHLS